MEVLKVTTNVFIQARCGDNKVVKVVVKDEVNIVEEYTLQDQEDKEIIVYDEREVSVKEVLKEELPEG